MGWRLYLAIVVAAVTTGGHPLKSQTPPIIVSEYFNTSPLPVEEWTELLVLADTLDLRGYVLTDNNQTQTQQQGGVRFRNVPLWSRLRAGTIIVINHRGSQVVDADPRDGYIEIGAQNTTYFEQIRLDNNPGLTWEDVALNVALQGDILQVLDPQGRHVHALGHRDVPGPFFDSLPPPKVHHNGPCPNPGSVRVVPGLSTAAYASGSGIDSTAAQTEDVTKGLPNQSPRHRDLNQLLWRRVRQPRWNAPAFQRTELTTAGVVLEWSAAEDAYPQDSLQGYIVVRDTVGRRSVPEDGRTYAVGERIGTGIVVAQTLGATRRAVDTFPFPCGARLTYHVYAFRYWTDNRLGNAPGATLARGRSYAEESYAEATVEKPLPPVPQVRASAREVCEGDSIVLWVENADTAAYRYQWTLNGVQLVGATEPRLVVRTSGRYAVQARTALGCVTSAEIEVRVHPRPRLWVAVEGDSLLCPGDTAVLRASGAWRYRWYYEGTPVDSSPVLRTTRPGRYWVTGWSEAGCIGTSGVIELKLRRVELVADSAVLDFGVLGACESVRERTVRLTNRGNVPVLLFRPSLPSGFAIVGQSFPAEVPVGQSLTLRVRFAPPRGGSYGGVVRFLTLPCSAVVELSVRGERQPGIASFGMAELSFGTEALCQARPRDTTVWLYNQSGTQLTAEAAQVGTPFQLLGPAFPVELAAGDSIALRLRYTPVIGTHAQELAVAVRAGQCQDTVRVSLTATAALPQVRLSASQIELPALRGCQVVAETSLVVSNVGILPARVEVLPAVGISVFGMPAELQPSESRTVRLRVVPPGQGLFQTEASFVVSPCGDTLRVPIRVLVEGVTAGLTVSGVDFGTAVWCGSLDTVEQAVEFRTNARDVRLVGYELVGDAEAFSVEWSAGTLLADGQSIHVRFHPRREGRYRAELEYRLQVDTCVLIQRLTLQGAAQAVGYELSADATDFGQVSLGQRGQRTLRIRNPNPFPIVLSAVEGIVPPFGLEAPPRLPDTLAGGEERWLRLFYAPAQAPRRDTLQLLLRWAEPCDTALQLTFIGEAVEAAVRPARLWLGMPVLRAKPGEQVVIPISAVLEDSGATVAVSFLRLRLRYDWRLYAVQHVEGASTLRWREQRPGELLVEADFPEGLLQEVPFRVVGKALWHPQIQTPLELLSDSIRATRLVLLSTRAGMLVVDSLCLAQQRRFGTGAATSIWVERDGDCLRLVLLLGSDEGADMRVVDLFGREVFRWRADSGRAGQRVEFRLPCTQMASGIYTAVVRQPDSPPRAVRFLWMP
ncbi:MAG: choice-of-anchor D domain-containing protein [Candidatus Kapabacteria bacterium]|nr:choice-of-anchor D domain-containing protein [Candidatus Kapabacteria bacterium]MDW8011665.1 choice-of-anchor D domain-containing protein [Bacteroidota bacterium]